MNGRVKRNAPSMSICVCVCASEQEWVRYEISNFTRKKICPNRKPDDCISKNMICFFVTFSKYGNVFNVSACVGASVCVVCVSAWFFSLSCFWDKFIISLYAHNKHVIFDYAWRLLTMVRVCVCVFLVFLHSITRKMVSLSFLLQFGLKKIEFFSTWPTHVATHARKHTLPWPLNFGYNLIDLLISLNLKAHSMPAIRLNIHPSISI